MRSILAAVGVLLRCGRSHVDLQQRPFGGQFGLHLRAVDRDRSGVGKRIVRQTDAAAAARVGEERRPPAPVLELVKPARRKPFS
jgi:hypothetical protein